MKIYKASCPYEVDKKKQDTISTLKQLKDNEVNAHEESQYKVQNTGTHSQMVWEMHKQLKIKYDRRLKEDILRKAKQTVEWSGENYTGTVPQFLHLKNGE